MSYTALITEKATGIVREVPFDLEWEDEGGEYVWSDGNFGCDCNRAIFFNGSAPPDGPLIAEECSRMFAESKFAVVIMVDDKVVYTDDEGVVDTFSRTVHRGSVVGTYKASGTWQILP